MLEIRNYLFQTVISNTEACKPMEITIKFILLIIKKINYVYF